MKIALMGPPNSGKSKLARAIAQELDIKSVVGYVDLIQKNSELALGGSATYWENFMVAGTRLAKEVSVGPGVDYVVAGTIVDTLCYAMVKADVVLNTSPQEDQRVAQAAQDAIRGLTTIYSQTWNYDLTFFLPYTRTQRKRREPWERVLEVVYADVIQAYGVPEVAILEGSSTQKFQTAMAEILTYEEDLVGENEETD